MIFFHILSYKRNDYMLKLCSSDMRRIHASISNNIVELKAIASGRGGLQKYIYHGTDAPGGSRLSILNTSDTTSFLLSYFQKVLAS